MIGLAFALRSLIRRCWKEALFLRQGMLLVDITTFFIVKIVLKCFIFRADLCQVFLRSLLSSTKFPILKETFQQRESFISGNIFII